DSDERSQPTAGSWYGRIEKSIGYRRRKRDGADSCNPGQYGCAKLAIAFRPTHQYKSINLLFFSDKNSASRCAVFVSTHSETFARCYERCENKAEICEKAEFTRGK